MNRIAIFLLPLALASCSQSKVSSSRAMLSRLHLASDEVAAQNAVRTLLAEQCKAECRFATENFGRKLRFSELSPTVKTIRYDRVFRRSTERSEEGMIRGETAGYIVTGVFTDGADEVLIDFTVREDVKGMTVDEIALLKE